MADAAREELLQLLRRIGGYLTVKMSHLFHIAPNLKGSQSAWALAGLAVAVILAWKLTRTPSEGQRRRHKRPGPASSSVASSQPTGVVRTYETSSTSEEVKAHDIDEFFFPTKPNLGQIVRQRFGEGRKVTCRLLGVILEERCPEELKDHVTVKSSVLEILNEVTKFCDIYLMERILDDESEEKILSSLDKAGIFTGGLVRDKVLFCSTETGRSSFVRQLEPDWHIDTNFEIVSQLARFIKYQLYISPDNPEHISSNVFTATSLEQFIGWSDQN